MSITNFIQKIKGFLDSEKGRLIAFILIVIFTGASSFLLGRVSLSLENKDNSCVNIENIKNANFDTNYNTMSTGVNNLGEASVIKSFSVKESVGNYVASKRGKRFYPIECSAASSIVLKNRVYFNTREEAIQKGYSPSPSCE